MRLQRESKALDALWQWFRTWQKSQEPVSPKDLAGGIYKVEMVTGWMPSLPKWFKTILEPTPPAMSITGYNATLGKKWGGFDVKKGRGILTLDYKNRLITDYVAPMADGLWLGRFYYRGEFRGWFWLIKQ